MSTPAPIPFSPPDIREEDIQAVVDVLRSGWITTGPVGKRFETELVERAGAGGGLLASSATTAAETALRLLGIGPGDEVVTSAYTYTASASVIAHVGATIKLVDVEPGSFTPSIDSYLAAVTPRTKAVIAVDLGGVPFDHLGLREALESRSSQFTASSPLQETLGRVAVVADAAHSLGASRDGQVSGSLADLSSFSFHAVKNLTTGEGGALLWRSIDGIDDAELRHRAQMSVMHGQSKDALSKSKMGAWEYDIVELGHKCNLPDILAALGLSQLQRYDATVDRRFEIIGAYDAAVAGTRLRSLVHEGEGFRSSGHLYLGQLPEADEQKRNDLITAMAEQGVATNVHYKPLPLLSAYRELGYDIGDFPNAFDTYAREITLPVHTCLTDEQVERVGRTYRECATKLGLA